MRRISSLSSFLQHRRIIPSSSSLFAPSIRSFHVSRASWLDINIDADFQKFEQMAEQGKVDEVIGVIEKDKQEGKITYKNAWRYIRGYALLKKEAEAESLYHQFLEQIAPEDTVSLVYLHSAILNVYFNTQNSDKASKIYRQMPKISKKNFEELLAQQQKK
ncbi:hypothetical protein FDP41_009683 [Naegleria fowleri]|uniref:Uncharacterized protein n=1 Tax=Naegleria fowleri TaxID=5763 RepID=A0A6A5B070_NAEFO|nr:uncharacterized protein FDP41_009683 [Naegleria fowleri]KAF0971987.1 hypothetical protein FDP41_009683 [Naegleria fowleri]CAG4711307.1 unnamed protein product [Naegleria fowleri]